MQSCNHPKQKDYHFGMYYAHPATVDYVERHMRTMVVFDETIHSRTALRYGIHKSKAAGSELIIINVFDREMLYYYDAMPQVGESMKRDSSLHIDEAIRIVKEEAGGIKASLIEEEGDFHRVVSKHAASEKVDIIFSPPRYRGQLKKSPCPVAFVPGRILAPVDHEDLSQASIDLLKTDAELSLSDVVVFGIVPVHIYSKNEQDVIQDITNKTAQMVKTVSRRLSKSGVKCRELLSAGYPDEEILKVSNDISASMIMFLSGLERPSELNKAVNLLIDDYGASINSPIFSFQSVGVSPSLVLRV